MGPRPYSENSSLPNDSSTNDALSTVTTQILAETPSPTTLSSATTPSPTPLEIIPIEHHVDTIVIQDNEELEGLMPCYPTPEDIMPYDHALPDFIRQITNQADLTNVQSLSLRVISTCISLHRMAAYLPNLRVLDLEGSILSSLRDIGCSFKNLQILKVGRCKLESLDGTFGFASLRELYAQKNLINDISPCSNLPHIKHIDVSGNRIRNISYAGFLSVCSKLKSITFTGNPATEVDDYRKHVRRILPQIETLDGVPFSNDDNVPEAKNTELVDSMGNESDSSLEYPDFCSVSASDSMNNLLDSEEDANYLEKKYKQARNADNQGQIDSFDCEIQEVPSGDNKKFDFHGDFKNEKSQKRKEGVLDRPKATKLTDNRNINIKQKCVSIQKLDKDIENRSKKSNLLKANLSEGFISLPEIVPGPTCSHVYPGKTTSLTAPIETKTFPNNERIIAAELDPEIGKQRWENQSSKACLRISNAVKNETPLETPEKFNLVPGITSLTSGLPISGNLTAALRNRSRCQESRLENFKNKAEYFDIQ